MSSIWGSYARERPVLHQSNYESGSHDGPRDGPKRGSYWISLC